jgi:cysteine desulfuration protein SufE
MALPARLERLVKLFASSPRNIKVEALVDYSDRLPDLPAGIESSLERVHECQTPFFVTTQLGDDGAVHLYFEVPRESPTMRGFAGFLADGLEGATAAEVLAVPDAFYVEMGLEEVVTPLRLRGMGAILARIKQQLRRQMGAAAG